MAILQNVSNLSTIIIHCIYVDVAGLDEFVQIRVFIISTHNIIIIKIRVKFKKNPQKLLAKLLSNQIVKNINNYFCLRISKCNKVFCGKIIQNEKFYIS